MKVAKIGCMVLGIALMIFIVASVATAQEGWYEGKISVKGNELNNPSFSNVSGSGKAFAFIYEDDIDDEYEICTCIQGMDDDTWRGYWSYLPYSQSWVWPGERVVLDFTDNALSFDLGGLGNAVTKPIIIIKVSGEKFSGKTSGCIFRNFSESLTNPDLGSCKITFKNVPDVKVADKVPQACLSDCTRP